MSRFGLLATLNGILVGLGTLAFSSLPAIAGDNPLMRNSDQPHQAQFLEHPGGALGKYLETIDRAKSSVNMEYFIFNPCGSTGRLVINALAEKVRAAKAEGRSLQARFLIDDFNFFRWTKVPREAFIAEMAELGIEVKIYNPIPTRIQRGNQRDHRKLLVADGREAITGGRNIDDDYFGLAQGLNFVDHDLLVHGPIAGSMQESFNTFWNDSLSESPDGSGRDEYGLAYKMDPARLASERNWVRRCIQPRPGDLALRERLKLEARRLDQTNPMVSCPSMAFASDAPHDYWRNSRNTAKLFQGAMDDAQSTVLMENYDFAPNGAVKEVLGSLKTRKIETDILTNGYKTEPQQYLSHIQHERALEWADPHFRIHSLASRNAGSQSWYFDNSSAIWSIHSKSAVIDSKSVVVGSMNLDPRSVEQNTEMALYARQCPALAGQLEHAIHDLQLRDSTPVYSGSQYSRCYLASRIDPLKSSLRNTLENTGDDVAAWLLSDFY